MDMNKKFWALLLILPLVSFCGSDKPEPEPEPEQTDPEIIVSGDAEITVGCESGSGTLTFTSNVDWTAAADDAWMTVTPESGKASKSPVTLTYQYGQNPNLKNRSTYIVISAYGAEKNVSVVQAGDPMAGAAVELKDGDQVLATNPLVEKFLTEVTYKDWPEETTRATRIFDYYGGFDGKTLTWENWETDWPDGDKPQAYSLRWKKEDMESGAMTIHLEDELGWSGNMEIAAGSRYVNITNLVPNDHYSYKVTAASGKVLTQGSFTTTGSLHQVFFTGPVTKKKGVEMKGSGCRNARDLGGWTTLDGKKVKYRKVYRGGRMNEKWTPYPLNEQGQKEVLFEGIGGELDLRGNSDVIFEPAVEGLAHCAPVIEEGGKTMLVTYKEQTKQCFEFVVDCVRNNKPVYFHCSLGRDRTGTLDILLLGLLGVREGDIAKEYEVTYFAPVGYSVSSSDKKTNTIPTFHNTRLAWVYSDVTPYFWELAGEGGTFAQGVEKYLLDVAGVSQKDIDDFRKLMLD